MAKFWHKLNPVKLFRKQSAYITLPAFNFSGERIIDEVPTCWGQFNYASLSSFAFKNISKPSDFCGTVVVRFRYGSLVYRFKLWSNDYIPNIPVYNGEVIPKNFTLELWPDYDDATEQVTNIDPVRLDQTIKKAKTTLTDEDTYESVTNTDGLVTELYANGVAGASAISSANSEAAVVANGNITYFAAAYPAGTYRLVYVRGALEDVIDGGFGASGCVNIGNFILVNNARVELADCPKFATDKQTTQALYEYINSGAGVEVVLAQDYAAGTLGVCTEDPGGVAGTAPGTPTPTYALTAVMSLPLTYTEVQHGISN